MSKVILNKPCVRPQNTKPVLNSEVSNVKPQHRELKKKPPQELATQLSITITYVYYA